MESGELYPDYTYLNTTYIKEINQIYDETNNCFIYTTFFDDGNFEFEISEEEFKKLKGGD